MKRYIVTLTEEERDQLLAIVRTGSAQAYRIRHAAILLHTDENGPKQTDAAITQALHCHKNSVVGIRKRFVEHGLEAALGRKKREKPPIAAIVDGETEARLFSIACGEPPEGYSRWSIRLLASRMVELGYVDHISRTTVHKALKKTSFDLTCANSG